MIQPRSVINDFMANGAWILMSRTYYIILLIVSFAVEGSAGDNGCAVYPSDVAVIADNYVSLTCTASSRPQVSAWSRGTDYRSSSIVYQAVVYGAAGSTVSPRILVDGYFVDDSSATRVILMMNNTSTVQADRYYCLCYPKLSDTASVTIVDSKPTFSTINDRPITDGGPVNIRCSFKFNGTADASVAITDVSGVQVNQTSVFGIYPSNSKDLQVINLDYSLTADSRINQTYLCQVNLTQNSNRIYYDQVITSVNWTSVGDVQITPVDLSRCFNGGQCAINQAIQCKAGKGNPVPDLFQWTGAMNGISFSVNTSGPFNLTGTGNYTIQCTAFNVIGSITYSNTSDYFRTNVTVDGPTPLPATQSSAHNSLVIGLGVGLGVGIPILVLIVTGIFLYFKRKKIQQIKADLYTTFTPATSQQQDVYAELQKSTVDNDLQNGNPVEKYETVVM